MKGYEMEMNARKAEVDSLNGKERENKCLEVIFGQYDVKGRWEK